MKEKLTQLIKKITPEIIAWLQKLLDSTKTNSYKPIALETLTPTRDADEDNIYKSALKNAIDNPNNYNIGVAGAYGSGKSSILESFKKKHENEYRFLSISLASFNENNLTESEIRKEPKNSINENINDYETSKDDDSKHEVNQLIELSILQQLLYHVKIKDLPNSRFKRIKRHKWYWVALYSLFSFVWLLSIIIISEPSFIRSTTLWGKLNWKDNANLFSTTSFVLFAVGFVILFYQIIRLANNSRLSKLNLKDGEIEIDCPNDRSILNRYLDEVFYFFEMTKHNVVIVEDLDRLKNSMIFTKLRELNSLLNNSDQIKNGVGRIVFIYALRDDLFKDKSRTKFFDIIIPVIPIINTTNSGDMFLQLLKKSDPKHSLSTEFISDISLFIDDMRLLKNIYNEYLIYKEKLTEVPDQNKLLAMIVYKNIFPTDFVDLHNGNGIIYRVLKSERNKLVQDAINSIDQQIEALELQIKESKNLAVVNESELNSVYINSLLRKIPTDTNSISINGETVRFPQLVDPNIFIKIRNFGVNYNPGYRNTHIAFKDIEKEANVNKTYDERLELILLKEKKEIELQMQKIEKLRAEKNLIKSKSITKIAEKQNLADTFIELKETKYKLALYLLRKGYINEDYDIYISFFHEGSLTPDDRNFLLSIKGSEALDFRFKLNNIKEIISKLRISEFEQTEILNINLLDYLISNKKDYESQLNKFINQLSNESQRSIEFIDIYIEEGKNVKFVIEQLANRWSGIWNYIEIISNYSNQRKDKYLELIITHAQLADIEKLDEGDQFSTYIENNPKFLSLIPDKIIEKVKSIIENLGVVFKALEPRATNAKLFDFIYQNDWYEINPVTIELFISEKGNKVEFLSEKLKTQNFSVIRSTNCQPLMAYIYKNIGEYLENVFLKLDENKEENEDTVLDLLNNSDIDNDIKEKIIKTNNTKLTDLSKVENQDLFPFIAKHSKMLPVWENIYTYLEEKTEETEQEDSIKKLKPIDDALTIFLNQETNYKELSTKNIDKIGNQDSTVILKLAELIVLCQGLTIHSFMDLRGSIPITYDFLPCNNLSEDKIDCMIYTGMLNPTPKNFDYLKKHFPQKHIKLIEIRSSVFISSLGEFTIDSVDSLGILKSTLFSKEQKIILIKSLDKTIIAGEKELCDCICEILTSSKYIELPIDFILNLFKYGTENRNKIKLLNLQFENRKISNTSITDLLLAINVPFSSIAEKGQHPKIKNNKENLAFAEHLELRDYISTYTVKGEYIKINTKRK